MASTRPATEAARSGTPRRTRLMPEAYRRGRETGREACARGRSAAWSSLILGRFVGYRVESSGALWRRSARAGAGSDGTTTTWSAAIRPDTIIPPARAPGQAKKWRGRTGRLGRGTRGYFGPERMLVLEVVRPELGKVIGPALHHGNEACSREGREAFSLDRRRAWSTNWSDRWGSALIGRGRSTRAIRSASPCPPNGSAFT